SMTQTGSLSTLVWTVSHLAPGQGGSVTIHATVPYTLNVATDVVNRAGITGTLDMPQANNHTLVSNALVVPQVTISPTVYSVLESAGSVLATVVVDRVNPYAAVTVAYATADGSAEAG